MIENLIINQLLIDDKYARATLPFLKSEYFKQDSYKTVFNLIKNYIDKYNSNPTQEALKIELDKLSINSTLFENTKLIIDSLSGETQDYEWILDETEKFCQESAIHNAIKESISILDENNTKNKKTKGEIPELLSEALSVSFDINIGHDVTEDIESRYEYYNQKEDKFPFDLEYLNYITKGGIAKKTLNVILAGVNVGKTLTMCHLASHYLRQGKNVLYISMEMSEKEISKRIDVNMLNITFDELDEISKETYLSKWNRQKQKQLGKIVVKEYPTSSAHVGHFRHLLQELRLKKHFVPDIIIVDYINICASSRVKLGGSVNTYLLIKSIAEELRGFAVENNVPIITATQIKREAFNSSDIDMTATSESWSLPAICDFMIALITNDELEKLQQFMVIQLKNRYNSKRKNKKFVIGVDVDRSKLYDVEQDAQPNDDTDIPVMDNTDYGERYNEDDSMIKLTKFAGRKNFSNFKFK